MAASDIVWSLRSGHVATTWSIKVSGERAVRPVSMRRDDHDNIWIMDAMNKCVKVFSKKGDWVQKIPSEENNMSDVQQAILSHLSYPVGIATVGGVTWFTDKHSSTLYSFDDQGSLMCDMAYPALAQPIDVLPKPDSEELFIVNNDGASLVQFSLKTKTFLKEWEHLPVELYGGSSFNKDKDKVIISDKTEGKLVIVNIKLNLDTPYSVKIRTGQPENNPITPGGVCVGCDGLVYVTDVNNNKIHVLSEMFVYINSINTSQWFDDVIASAMETELPTPELHEPLSGPIDVALLSRDGSRDNRLLVLEHSGRVKVFNYRRRRLGSVVSETCRIL